MNIYEYFETIQKQIQNTTNSYTKRFKIFLVKFHFVGNNSSYRNFISIIDYFLHIDLHQWSCFVFTCVWWWIVSHSRWTTIWSISIRLCNCDFSSNFYFLLWSWFCAEIVNFETTRVKARFSARRRSFSVLYFWSCYI